MCLNSIEHADKMKYDVKKERENIVTNVELLVMTSSFICHNVFKSLVLQKC